MSEDINLSRAYAIEAQDREIDKTKQELKTKKEMLSDYISNSQTWLDLESAKTEVTRLKAKLQSELTASADYNNQLEDIGGLKTKLKDQKETMSMMIVGYFAETKEQQIEVDANGDARELVISGKLGKKSKYQTNLFNNNGDS